ncbi:MAG: hypothetical protein AAGL89_10680 [Pseudomonadota bacterium]
MADAYASHQLSLESPAVRIFPVSPDDGVDLPEVSRAINVATTGAVRITTVGGTTATIYVAAGMAFPVRAKRIWQTGTDATGVVALA